VCVRFHPLQKQRNSSQESENAPVEWIRLSVYATRGADEIHYHRPGINISAGNFSSRDLTIKIYAPEQRNVTLNLSGARDIYLLVLR